jgi:LysM repeat protein
MKHAPRVCLAVSRAFLIGVGLAGLSGIGWLEETGIEAAPRDDGASELIEAVNQLRASQGMDPLKIDPILMLVAQKQNDYSISIGQISHYGPDGSRPRDQAIAAGYGGGTTVFISENIVMGTGLTPGGAVEWWTGDEPHLNTMLGTYYRDVGAGAGEADGAHYYTLVTGYVAGGLSANSTVPAGDAGGPSLSGLAQLITSTPQADGAIVHVVEEGQALWTIAAIYGVNLDELLSLNGLTVDSVVLPGDRLIVRPAPTATPSPEPTATISPTPSPPTPVPTPTPRPNVVQVIAATIGDPAFWRRIGFGVLIVAWVGLLAGGIIVARRRF